MCQASNSLLIFTLIFTRTDDDPQLDSRYRHDEAATVYQDTSDFSEARVQHPKLQLTRIYNAIYRLFSKSSLRKGVEISTRR